MFDPELYASWLLDVLVKGASYVRDMLPTDWGFAPIAEAGAAFFLTLVDYLRLGSYFIDMQMVITWLGLLLAAELSLSVFRAVTMARRVF